MKKLVCIWMLFFTVFVAGCWDKRELDQLAIVLGTGLDSGAKGKIKLTTEVARPSAMGGGSMGGGGGQEEPVLILEMEGVTVFDAVRNAIDINSRKLFFSHNQVLIIGENLARDGVQPVVDFFERDPELRTEVSIAIASGQAGEILRVNSKLEKSTAVSINMTLNAEETNGRVANVKYHEFIMKYDGQITSPVAPYIAVSKTGEMPTYRVQGLAVFKDQKMIGHLNREATRGFLWLTDKRKDGIMPIKIPGHKGFGITIEVGQAKTKTSVKFSGGKPFFEVAVEASGSVGEVRSPLDISKPEVLTEIEKAYKEAIIGQMKTALDKSQKTFKNDIFGFGEIIRAHHPKEWQKLKQNWHNRFAKVPVKLTVKTTIVDSGEKTKPSHIIE